MQTINVKSLRCIQPIGVFYTAIINHEDLIYLTYVDIRRLDTGSEKREVEVYTGIQRELSQRRVKEIGKYVNMVDASFPNSIILHIEPEDILNYDEVTGEVTLPYRDNVAKVLDGQHRIAGLENFEQGGSTFQMIITIFVGMELEDQAIIFSTINKTQTKVNNSLVADLFDFATNRSPNKTAHNIVRALNQKEGSPFYKKIKILGVANDKERETITQATFSKSLMDLFSKDLMSDRDLYKRGKTPSEFEGKELIKRPLRNIFIQKEDGKIAQLMWNYFAAVKNRWSIAWDDTTNTFILNKSTGFIALMRFFKEVYLSFGRIGDVISEEEFEGIFNTIDIDESDFVKEVYIPGSSGQGQLYRDLIEKAHLQYNDDDIF